MLLVKVWFLDRFFMKLFLCLDFCIPPALMIEDMEYEILMSTLESLQASDLSAVNEFLGLLHPKMNTEIRNNLGYSFLYHCYGICSASQIAFYPSTEYADNKQTVRIV